MQGCRLRPYWVPIEYDRCRCNVFPSSSYASYHRGGSKVTHYDRRSGWKVEVRSVAKENGGVSRHAFRPTSRCCGTSDTLAAMWGYCYRHCNCLQPEQFVTWVKSIFCPVLISDRSLVFGRFSVSLVCPSGSWRWWWWWNISGIILMEEDEVS
jgi:hypothetical protein